jgi:hypothetical protein
MPADGISLTPPRQMQKLSAEFMVFHLYVRPKIRHAVLSASCYYSIKSYPN